MRQARTYALDAAHIRPLVDGYGSALATDMITVDGFPVRFMYREAPDHDIDSGWRFFSGFEDEAYMRDIDRHDVYDVNTIANYDPSIIPLLDAPVGAVFEKTAESERFLHVPGWRPGGAPDRGAPDSD